LLEEGRVAWREEKGMEASKVVKLMKFWGCPRCYDCPRRIGSQYFYGNLTFFGLCGVLARARRALSDLLDTKPVGGGFWNPLYLSPSLYQFAVSFRGRATIPALGDVQLRSSNLDTFWCSNWQTCTGGVRNKEPTPLFGNTTAVASLLR
jgi:hypothetical protein